ncbi:MAG TPA: M20/M25/M40 family metallo-hydrolase [Thermomicrobiales bacterium]|jgi:acetylornithine deacetylase/succinyl-diaminopimelate desuccinylase-like protein|nr:M20/M25/M40 family metallo-hydrolase [Thermomicrobiales bacterium]
MTVESHLPVTEQTIADRATSILQDLIRIDTSNPPGNESAAGEYIASLTREAGFETEIVEGVPGRGSLVARYRSAKPTGRPIMLTAHLDVVSVERDKWTRDPFGGELVDGYVSGRGALDIKSLVAAELAVALELAGSGTALDRDLILAFFADEEAGGEHGAAWLWQNRPELLDAEYAINEGGGTAIRVAGRNFYLCQTGEKGASRLRIIARGAPGHASIPLDDTAMRRLGEALSRLTAWTAPTRLTEPVRQMLQAMAPALGADASAMIERVLDAPDGELSWDDIAALGLPFDAETMAMLRATTRDTAVPTLVHGGHRINVIPSEIVLDVDGRILPGTDPEEWRQRVQDVVGDGVEVQLLSRESGILADPASPFFEAISATIEAMDPGSVVVPYLVSGGTDARNIPGVKVYGFMPFEPGVRNAEYVPLVHGHDERIHVDDLRYATRFLRDLVLRFAAA